MTERKKKVCLVVLGDIGRSPRMQYHGLSFLENGYLVEFVGYSGSQPIKTLRSKENVKFSHLYHCPEFKQYFPTIIAYILKVLWQTVTLFLALIFAGVPDFLLVQNPPAIPSLWVCYIYCRIFRSKFIIDWHNYAFSILALSLGSEHKLVKFSKQLEFYIGKQADNNLCVTKAMREDLKKTYGINSNVFYDHPPNFFKKTSIEEQHRLFLSLGIEHEIFLKNCSFGETAFTKVNDNSEIVLKKDRPGLLVSSTSWTEDEDFQILLSALQEYEDAKNFKEKIPKLICAITGKGPLKEFYINIINRKKWKHVHVITPWLETEDYPTFLGSADLGVCLHKSSSGLDLPMKVSDMFGCLVPVCAIDFQCLSELIKHEENGFIFKDENELFLQIKNWFQGFPESEIAIRNTINENLKKFQSVRWHDNWIVNVQPLF